MKIAAIALTAALALAAAPIASAADMAAAEIVGADGAVIGKATFEQTPGGVLVSVEATGLPPGGHGIHLHAVGACTPDFKADPATYTHEFVSGTIRASGSNTPRQQAGHKTVPDLAAMPSKSPCNVGAIHTRHSGSRFAPQIRCHEIARHRLTVYECLPDMHMSLGCVKGRPIAEKVEHRLTVIVSADVVAHRGATHSRRRI